MLVLMLMLVHLYLYLLVLASPLALTPSHAMPSVKIAGVLIRHLKLQLEWLLKADVGGGNPNFAPLELRRSSQYEEKGSRVYTAKPHNGSNQSAIALVRAAGFESAKPIRAIIDDLAGLRKGLIEIGLESTAVRLGNRDQFHASNPRFQP